MVSLRADFWYSIVIVYTIERNNAESLIVAILSNNAYAVKPGCVVVLIP